jgi:PHD/YefM family antitoxin component YafN of YafNO toxin-antitoxin module
MREEPGMEARYLTDENGKRIGVVLDIEEYERLREIETDMEDIQRYDEAMGAIESGKDEVIPWEQAVREIREGRVPE